MILYYAVLPGGERLFVDPAGEKLEVVSEFKDSFSYENPGTSQEWLDDFLGQQEDFLEWAKEKTAAFPEAEGECGYYDFGETDLHLIKADITMEGEHRSCVVFNKKETDQPVNGIGTMEEWDEDGRISIRRHGFIVDGKLQGWGEKIDFSGNDCGGSPEGKPGSHPFVLKRRPIAARQFSVPLPVCEKTKPAFLPEGETQAAMGIFWKAECRQPRRDQAFLI